MQDLQSTHILSFQAVLPKTAPQALNSRKIQIYSSSLGNLKLKAHIKAIIHATPVQPKNKVKSHIAPEFGCALLEAIMAGKT